MKPAEFVNSFRDDALAVQTETGLNALSILAQAALESAWGRCAPGNMFFGVKDSDGINGNEQLLITTEYSKRADLKFPVIISIKPVIRNGQKYFKYTVKDYFRKFDSPQDCFRKHAEFFATRKIYAAAWAIRHDAYAFFIEISKAGYASDPDYANTLKKVSETVKKFL